MLLLFAYYEQLNYIQFQADHSYFPSKRRQYESIGFCIYLHRRRLSSRFCPVPFILLEDIQMEIGSAQTGSP